MTYLCLGRCSQRLASFVCIEFRAALIPIIKFEHSCVGLLSTSFGLSFYNLDRYDTLCSTSRPRNPPTSTNQPAVSFTTLSASANLFAYSFANTTIVRAHRTPHSGRPQHGQRAHQQSTYQPCHSTSYLGDFVHAVTPDAMCSVCRKRKDRIVTIINGLPAELFTQIDSLYSIQMSHQL